MPCDQTTGPTGRFASEAIPGADYRLYCTAVSGNCYKVALMLSHSKCSWEPVLVDYMGERRGARNSGPSSTSWARFRCRSMAKRPTQMRRLASSLNCRRPSRGGIKSDGCSLGIGPHIGPDLGHVLN